jgi:hypothetical protein
LPDGLQQWANVARPNRDNQQPGLRDGISQIRLDPHAKLVLQRSHFIRVAIVHDDRCFIAGEAKTSQ